MKQDFIVFAFLRKTPLHDEVLKGKSDAGLFNGYVAFSNILPFGDTFEWPEDENWDNFDPIDHHVDVHGGITLDYIQSDEYMPMIPLTEIPDSSFFEGLRVIGFDTQHLGDTKEWDFDAVKKETLRMYEQVVALLKQYSNVPKISEEELKEFMKDIPENEDKMIALSEHHKMICEEYDLDPEELSFAENVELYLLHKKTGLWIL